MPGIEPLIIDITNPVHILALAARVNEDPQGRAVRAVVKNAGIRVNAPVEVFANRSFVHAGLMRFSLWVSARAVAI